MVVLSTLVSMLTVFIVSRMLLMNSFVLMASVLVVSVHRLVIMIVAVVFTS